jgi:hypothetical protein
MSVERRVLAWAAQNPRNVPRSRALLWLASLRGEGMPSGQPAEAGPRRAGAAALDVVTYQLLSAGCRAFAAWWPPGPAPVLGPHAGSADAHAVVRELSGYPDAFSHRQHQPGAIYADLFDLAPGAVQRLEQAVAAVLSSTGSSHGCGSTSTTPPSRSGPSSCAACWPVWVSPTSVVALVLSAAAPCSAFGEPAIRSSSRVGILSVLVVAPHAHAKLGAAVLHSCHGLLRLRASSGRVP